MLVYLASPYTDPDKRVRRRRAKEVIHLAVRLISAHPEARVYSPIAHTHAMAEAGDLPAEFDYWEEFDRRVLTICDELWIAQIEGWDKSIGIFSEIGIMRQLGKPIKFVNPETLAMEVDH